MRATCVTSIPSSPLSNLGADGYIVRLLTPDSYPNLEMALFVTSSSGDEFVVDADGRLARRARTAAGGVSRRVPWERAGRGELMSTASRAPSRVGHPPGVVGRQDAQQAGPRERL